MIRLIVFAFLLGLHGEAASQSSAERTVVRNKDAILKASRLFGVSSRLLAGVIYTEQSLNMHAGEAILDVVFARSGYNTSVGLAQVKVETARWIEERLASPEDEFFLGRELASAIRMSHSDSELIDRLSTDSINVLYAAAYLAMINKVWAQTLKSSLFEHRREGILATIYSLGIARWDGSLRRPHDQAKMSGFGKAVQEFVDSSELRVEFPR